MYRVITTYKKNESDPWINASTTEYFMQEELNNEVADFINVTSNSPGVSNLSFQQISTTESKTTYYVDTLENLNNYENTISNHPFMALRNKKLREYRVPQYLVSRNITEI